MGVDTEGLLNKEVSVMEVKAAIEEMIQDDVELIDNGRNFYTLSFSYKGVGRNLSLFEHYSSEILNGEVVTLLNLSKFGYANEIMHSLVSYFGGLYIEDDCSSDEPVYLEKNGDYIENSSMKSDKEFMKLMTEFDLPINQKMNFISFIKKYNKEINELINKI